MSLTTSPTNQPPQAGRPGLLRRLRGLGILNAAGWSLRLKLILAVTIPAIFTVIAALAAMGLFVRYNPLATTAVYTAMAFSLALIAAIGVGISLLVGFLAWATIWQPFLRLRGGLEQIANGNYDQPIPTTRGNDELNATTRLINAFAERLQREFTTLEDSVAQRTRDLDAAREIGTILTTLRDIDAISERVITLIQEQFPQIYHAQVFLVDDRRVDAVLRASTGEVGRKLLTRGHRLEVGSRSVIGQVTARGEPVIALDTARDVVHRTNELLPETRAELALPIRTQDGIIGALDLQSRSVDAFTDSDVRLFQTIADQLSTALQNARSFEESRARLRDIEDLNKLLITETWQNYGESRKGRAKVAIRGDQGLTALQQRAIETRETTEEPDGENLRFAIPILLRGQAIGAVEWTLRRNAYTENTRLLTEELVERLALAADNARLVETSQQIAERERLLNEITGKLTQETDVERIMQAAVRELGQALPTAQTRIRLRGDR